MHLLYENVHFQHLIPLRHFGGKSIFRYSGPGSIIRLEATNRRNFFMQAALTVFFILERIK